MPPSPGLRCRRHASTRSSGAGSSPPGGGSPCRGASRSTAPRRPAGRDTWRSPARSCCRRRRPRGRPCPFRCPRSCSPPSSVPTLTIMRNDADRVLHVSHPRTTVELAADDTHGTANLSPNRLVLDSTGLGWRDAYTSLTSESAWSATLPALPHLSLAYCVRRSARIRRRVDGSRVETTDLVPRRFGMIPADRSSTWQVDGDPDVQLVYIRRETIDELAIDELGADPARVEVEPRLGFGAPVLEPLVLSLLDAARRRVPMSSSAVWADHVVRLIGIELLQRYSNLDGRAPSGCDLTRARVATTCEYVDANLTGDLSLYGIASAVQVRPHRLARDFRDRTGVPLHQYVLGRRVDTAARLLRSSRTPLATIAVECGFADQSHLTTAFRKRIGVTPAVYREG